MSQPKIAFFDIENTPSLGWTWENYDANVIRTEKDWHMLSFSVRWGHKKKIETYALPDFPGYEKNKSCDLALSKKLWEVFDEADILIAHNSDFDIKKSQARFLVHGFRPPSSWKSICTLKISRRCFKFNSNRLGDLANYLGIGAKLQTGGKDLWFACMAGDAKSWEILRRYNAHDVYLLREVYERMKPWAPNHPNVTLYKDKIDKPECPTCGSAKVQRRGFMVKLQTRRPRYHCQSCGAWHAGKAE